jgi:hypothetical protein
VSRYLFFDRDDNLYTYKENESESKKHKLGSLLQLFT